MTEYKILIAGSGGVGKTAFVSSIRGLQFDPRYNPTIGAEVRPATYKDVNMTFWDLAGQERYTDQTEYFQGCHGAIVMYDDSNISHRNVQHYLNQIVNASGRVPIVVVRNKSDVRGGNRDAIQVSSKNHTGAEEVIETLYRMLTVAAV